MTSAIFREMEQIGRETRYGAVGAGKGEGSVMKITLGATHLRHGRGVKQYEADMKSVTPLAKAALIFYGGLIVMTLNVIVSTAVFIFEPSGRVPEVYGTLVGVWFATFVLNWLLHVWRTRS